MKNRKLLLLTTAALLAAAITAMTMLHVPIPGGYIHLGDALIYLSAALLPTPYAVGAAVVGAGLADLMAAPLWLPATAVIKALVVLPFTSRRETLLNGRNGLAAVLSGVITVAGYCLAEALLFGGWAALAAAVVGNLLQAVGSAVLFFALAALLDRIGLKRRLPALASF